MSGPQTGGTVDLGTPLDDFVVLRIQTHRPSKWRFVDTETGEVWAWVNGRYQRSELPQSGSVP